MGSSFGRVHSANSFGSKASAARCRKLRRRKLPDPADRALSSGSRRCLGLRGRAAHERDIDALAGIAEQVRRENAKGDMAVVRDETRPATGKKLAVLHCGEMIDRPAVRAAIQKAIEVMRPSYEAR